MADARTDAEPTLTRDDTPLDELRAKLPPSGAYIKVYQRAPLPASWHGKMMLKAVIEDLTMDDLEVWLREYGREQGWDSGSYRLYAYVRGRKGYVWFRDVCLEIPGRPVTATTPSPAPAAAPGAPPSSAEAAVNAIITLWRAARELQGDAVAAPAPATPPAPDFSALVSALKELRGADPSGEVARAASQVGQAITTALGSMLGPVLGALAQQHAAREGSAAGATLPELIQAVKALQEVSGAGPAREEPEAEGGGGSHVAAEVRSLLGLIRELQETVTPAPRAPGLFAMVAQSLLSNQALWEAVGRWADAVRAMVAPPAPAPMIGAVPPGGTPAAPASPSPPGAAPASPSPPGAAPGAPGSTPLLGSLTSHLARAIERQDATFYPLLAQQLSAHPIGAPLVEQLRRGAVRPDTLVQLLAQAGLPELQLAGASAYLLGWAQWLTAGATAGPAPAAATAPTAAPRVSAAADDATTILHCRRCGAEYSFTPRTWQEYLDDYGAPRCSATDGSQTAEGRPILCWGDLAGEPPSGAEEAG